MAGFNNSRAIATAVLMPTTAAPDPIFGPIGSVYINNNRFLHAYGTQNTFLGQNAGNFTLNTGSSIGNLGIGTSSLSALTTGGANTCAGDSSGAAITTGANNTAIGTSSLEILTTGNENTAVGSGALELATTATFNTAVGSGALSDITTATSNTALGINAGTNYTTENSNLVLGNTGTVGDANWIRIGQQGAGLAQQNKCNIAGIYGITPGSATIARVIIDDTGQLGTQAGGGTSIDTITGNDGVPRSPVAGNFNLLTANATVLFIGTAATETLDFNRTTNLVLGSSLPSLGVGARNVGVGSIVLNAATTAADNVAIGFQAGKFITSGAGNILLGSLTGASLTNGVSNIALGSAALTNAPSAVANILLGDAAGNNYTGTENSNIIIGHGILGTLGETNVIRIGTYGAGLQQQNKSFIAATYSNFGTNNAFVGENAGNTTLTIGSAINNTSVGRNTLLGLTTGDSNTGIGSFSLTNVTTGNDNTALGKFAGDSLTTGSDNICIGSGAGSNYTIESNNIAIGLPGVVADASTTRIANIYGTAVGATNAVVVIDNTGKLGTNAGGAPILTITGNIGGAQSPVAGNFNIVTANSTVQFAGTAGTETLDFNRTTNLILGSSLPALTTGVNNVGVGVNVLNTLTSGQANVVIGWRAGDALTSGSGNIAMGLNSLGSAATSGSNIAIGSSTLALAISTNNNIAIGAGSLVIYNGNATTDANIAIGVGALDTLLFGRYNIAIGQDAASNYVNNETSNILLSSAGVVAENNTIRIGTQGTGLGQQNRAFMAGVYNVTPAVASPEIVVIDSAGQLGSTSGGIPTATVIVTTSITMSPNTQYIIQAGAPVNLLLPPVSAVGDVIRIIGDSDLWTITQAAGQQISYVGFDTTLGVGGSVAALQGSDCAELICVDANLRWTIFNGLANLNVV